MRTVLCRWVIVMKLVTIDRFETTDQGTFGVLRAHGFSCFTAELPWRDNEAGVSCIPTGRYRAIWAVSPRLRRSTYRLVNVPNRGGILLHSANFSGDAKKGMKCQLLGCIALGEKVGRMDGQRALLLSKPAMRRFETLMGGEPFDLEIRDAAEETVQG